MLPPNAKNGAFGGPTEHGGSPLRRVVARERNAGQREMTAIGLRRHGKMVTMSALKDKLKADLTTSMKARDEVRTRTLRMALAAVSTEEVAGKSARELTDDEIVKVLTRKPRSAARRPRRSRALDGPSRRRRSRTSTPCSRSTFPPS